MNSDRKYLKNILVMYHGGNCSDGFGAAYSAWKKFGDAADYVPMVYAQEFLPDVKDKEVYVLDFSFDLEKYEDILKNAKSVQLLDHHATAMKSLCNCKGCFFDLNKSGAVLAWERFNPTKPIPRFLKLIQDGDLWKFKYPETRPFYSAINMVEKRFELWSKFEDEAFLVEFIDKGRWIEKNLEMQVKQITKDAKEVELMGVKGLMVNAPAAFASDVGNILANQCGTYGLVWCEQLNGIKCSLRSVPEFDASVIAQNFGGGGHPQACAFNFKSLAEFNEIVVNRKINRAVI